MTTKFGQKKEDMSIEELEAALDRLTKAQSSDDNPETRQYREDEIARLSEELHRKRGEVQEEFQIIEYVKTPLLQLGDRIEIVAIHPSLPIGVANAKCYGARRMQELIVDCPNCHFQCHDIKMELKSDGKMWTEDTCRNCGEKLPAICLG